MKKLTSILGTTLIAFSLNAFAADMGTEEEAQAMSEAAAALVNEQGETAFETFAAEGEYQNKDLYVFCMDMEGNMLSHPKKPELVGQNLLDFQEYGDKLFQEMIAVANAEGQGWVEYKWPHPETGDLSAKKTYVMKNDKDFFCGAGAYANDTAAAETTEAAPTDAAASTPADAGATEATPADAAAPATNQ